MRSKSIRKHLKSIVVFACRDVRNTVLRAQIFINYYIMFRSQQELNNDVPHYIFDHNFGVLSVSWLMQRELQPA